MFLRCVRAENRKLHGSAIWAVFLVVPVISALYGTNNYLQNLGILNNGWYDFWSQLTLFYALFFFAPMVAVYAAYLWRLEHHGHNWNLIMSAPVKPGYLFLAKFFAVTKITLLTQGWILVLYLLCGKLWARLPGWPPAEIILWLLRGMLGGFAIIALQLLFSMLVRSFALPVLAALAGGVAGAVLPMSGNGLWWPYRLMILGMNSNNTTDALAGETAAFVAACLVWTAALLGIAGVILHKKDVKSE